MKLPGKKKNPLQRFLDSVNDSLHVPSGIRSGLPSVGSDDVRKAGLIAGTLAGLTLGSAGISSLRRRTEGAVTDS